MIKASIYRIAVINPKNDIVLWVAEVVGVIARNEVLRDVARNFDESLEVVNLDLHPTRKPVTGKGYDRQGLCKWTQNTKREDIMKRYTKSLEDFN